jgi:hypothetical protein
LIRDLSDYRALPASCHVEALSLSDMEESSDGRTRIPVRTCAPGNKGWRYSGAVSDLIRKSERVKLLLA